MVLAALAMVVYSAGQDINVNKQVRWFLDHHVKNPHVRKLIEWATIHGGAYYSVVVAAAHIVGYLIAVNWFQVSHALAGQTLVMIAVGGSIMLLAGYLMMNQAASTSDTTPTTSGSQDKWWPQRVGLPPVPVNDFPCKKTSLPKQNFSWRRGNTVILIRFCTIEAHKTL